MTVLAISILCRLSGLRLGTHYYVHLIAHPLTHPIAFHMLSSVDYYLLQFSEAIIVASPLQIGTYQLAVMAKALNKPFYVVVESFKFVRMFPLNQDDLPNVEKV